MSGHYSTTESCEDNSSKYCRDLRSNQRQQEYNSKLALKLFLKELDTDALNGIVLSCEYSENENPGFDMNLFPGATTETACRNARSELRQR